MALSLEAERAEFELIPIPPTEAEWLEARRPWWGASIAACLFGEHEHITLGDACTEKIAGREAVSEDKQKLYDRGHRWERYIRDEVTEKWGLKLTEPSVMYRRGPMCSTPDAEAVGRDDVAVELKTAREFLDPFRVKRQWFWQAQAKNWCEDTERTLIAALDSSLNVIYFEIERDDDAIKMMVDRAQAMVEAIEWGVMPDGVELSAKNVSRMWPQDSGETVDVDPQVAQWVQLYTEAQANMKGWEAEKHRLRDLVVARIGSDSFAAVGGAQVASYRAAKDRSIVDWRKMIADHPDIAEQYTTIAPGVRTFRPTKSGLRLALERMEDDDEF